MVAHLGRSLAALLLALLASTTASADDALAKRIIATYSALESYCDTVAAQDPWHLVSELRRCYTRDGRYKRIEQLAPPAHQRRHQWGDDSLAYIWYTHPSAGTTLYMEQSPRSLAEPLPDGLAARALQPFLRFVKNETDVSKLLREMEVVEDGPDKMILQRQYKNPGSGNDVINRLWVRSDGLVTHGDETSNGEILWSATLVDARVNAPLSQADLSETAPFFQRFFHRYNLYTRPVEIVSALAALAFVVGFVLSIVWRQPRQWGRVWLIHARLIGIAIAILAALAVISLLPGMQGGHPPAIFVVLILAAFAGIGALVIAALLLGMQLVDLTRAAIR